MFESVCESWDLTSEVSSPWHLLRSGLLDSLACFTLNHLESLVGLVLGGVDLLLDGRSKSLGPRVKVPGQVGARRELGRVLSEILVKRSLKLAFLVALVAEC